MEKTFLYRELEDIYIECPQGISVIGKDDYIILNKCIYSLVQAVGHYHKKVIEKEIRIHRKKFQPIPLHQEECKGYSMCSSLC